MDKHEQEREWLSNRQRQERQSLEAHQKRERKEEGFDAFGNVLHVHVYDKDNNLIEEKDLELIENYRDYLQFGVQVGDNWIEIRVPRNWQAGTTTD